jgi:threonine dehydrogenase-like Zn-dependent dehydrogenase
MGHEFSGVVYAVGEGVDDIQIGQHVVVEPYIIADDVPTGPNDKYHLSKNMNFIGLGGRGGGLSEKIAVFNPSCAARIAATYPPGPAPITTRPNCVSDMTIPPTPKLMQDFRQTA